MNKKIASEIAIGIILLVAIIVGGIFYWQSEKVQTVAPAVSNQQSAVSDQQARPVENQKTQIPKAGYKILKISDGTTAFSFEIPEKWLTETRHSGEKQLTAEEMRDFLATNFDGDIKTNPKLTSDYADLPWTEIKKMSDNKIKELYNRNDKGVSLYPNASVGAGDHILYTDTSWQQIDFYIKNEPVENVIAKVKKEHYDYCKEYGNDIVGCGDDAPMWEQTVVGEKNTEVEIFMTEKDEKGNEIISKGGTGGKTYFVKISNGITLVISKQAKGDTKFETDFNNLIQTFKFTDITDETANWQTYTNEKYKYQIKYPNDVEYVNEAQIEEGMDDWTEKKYVDIELARYNGDVSIIAPDIDKNKNLNRCRSILNSNSDIPSGLLSYAKSSENIKIYGKNYKIITYNEVSPYISSLSSTVCLSDGTIIQLLSSSNDSFNNVFGNWKTVRQIAESYQKTK